LPGAANITTVANDCAIAIPISGGWQVVAYQRASGSPVSDSGLVLASGNLIDLRSTVPSSGSYVAGDIVLESTTTARISGWKRLTTGSGHVLNTDWLYFSGIGSGTPVATTSGTSIDFTGVPAGVRRITVMFNAVSTNGSSNYLIRIGAGSYESSGYSSTIWTTSTSIQSTAGFIVFSPVGAANNAVGIVQLSLLGSNVWVESGALAFGNTNSTGWTSAGQHSGLSGSLDRIRLTTVSGDTFDAGSINILWEF
jgi:hypothetical protein